jgi:nucleosome assembly protein 1-like 1
MNGDPAAAANEDHQFNDPDEKEIEQKMIKTILNMPEPVQNRFKVLHMLSDKRSKLNDEFNEACKKLEAKIMAKKAPFMEKRKQIISGELTAYGDLLTKFDTTHKELQEKVATIVKPEGEEKDEEKVPTDVNYLKGKAGVPDFWVRAIKSNRLIWDQVKEKDQPIMEYLKHVETEQGENEEKNLTLTLRMTFGSDNDHFKPYDLSTTLIYESEDRVKQIIGTKIEWLEGKDPTKKKIKKKQKHKKTGETRTVVKTVDAHSFFNVFTDRKVPAKDEVDSEEENDILDKIDEVQQIVEDFHDLLVPEALEYYLNLNEDFEMLGMDEGDESGGSGDEDDDEGDNKKDKKKKEEGGEGEQKQECKQQ